MDGTGGKTKLPVYGSYGTIFQSEEARPNSNLQLYYERLVHEMVKDQIGDVDPVTHKKSQEFGRLYSSGTYSEQVFSSTFKKKPPEESAVSLRGEKTSKAWTMESIHPPSSQQSKRGVRGNAAILLDDKQEGGSFYVPPILPEPYREGLLAEKANGSYLTTTPKTWPADGMYPTSQIKAKLLSRTAPKIRQNNKDNSKSKDFGFSLPSSITCSQTLKHSSSSPAGLSALQETLIGCGRLKYTNELTSQEVDHKVNKALKLQKLSLSDHGAWLADPTSINKQQKQQQVKSLSQSGQLGLDHKSGYSSLTYSNSPTKSLKFRNDDIVSCISDLDFPSSVRTQASKASSKSLKASSARRQISDYSVLVADHLGSKTSLTSTNPFRVQQKTESCLMSRPFKKHTSTLDYNSDTAVKQTGNMTICIRAPQSVGSAPSRRDITDVLTKVQRASLMRYDLKIVETGGAMKALYDVNNPFPGVAAVIGLHRAFVDAAMLNPNPWVLSRRQMEAVMSERVPWYAADARRRLLGAFDASGGGHVRFVRMSVALLCCARSAMPDLAALLNRKAAKKAGGDPTLTGKNAGLYLVMRLIHGLYEDCEGGVESGATSSSSSSSQTKSVGMRIDDVVEALTCSSTSIDDELCMEKALQPVIQLLFEWSEQRAKDALATPAPFRIDDDDDENADNRILDGDSSSINKIKGSIGEGSGASAAIVLRHHKLRDVHAVTRVSQDDFIRAVSTFPAVVDEFVRQLDLFRELTLPYTIRGSLPFDEACCKDVPIQFGTRNGRKWA